MITLALDTATSRCTIAVSDGDRAVSRQIDGARQHAGAVLGLADEALTELGISAADIEKVLTGDGPGSFTGLRVSAAVAKALVWGRDDVRWEVAPSLKVRAVGQLPVGGGTVLALSDALRGELYAGCWRFTERSVSAVFESEGAVTTESLASLCGIVDAVVGTIPESLIDAVRVSTGCQPVVGEAALPDASNLLKLAGMAGGTQPVSDPVGWHPHYGRPAEAQAVWERKHGRELPASTHRRG